MNIKIVMTSASIMLAITGIFLTFAPDVVSTSLNVETNPATLLIIQVMGGLYFG